MDRSLVRLTLAVAGTLTFLGCGDDTTAAPSPTQDMATPGSAGDMTSAAGDMAMQMAMARLRVAHLSPDTPAVDVCVAATGSTTFTGPLLKAAGDAAGLSYTQVTNYLPVPAATIGVRVVAAGAADCSTKLIPDTVGVTLAPDTSYTVAAVGLSMAGTPTIMLKAYVDETTVTAGMAKLRFVHVSPGTPSFPNVGMSFGGGTAVDSKGYVETGPLPANTQVGVRLTGMTATVLTVTLPAGLPAGAIATAFAVGLADGMGAQKLQALVCVDNVTGTGGGGLLANCAPISM